MTESWKLFALGSAIFAGLTAVFAKLGLTDVSSNFATLLRTLVILPLLGFLVIFQHEIRPLSSLSHRTLLFLFLSAVSTGLSWMCYFRALQLGPTSIVSSIDKLSLLVAVILSVAFLGEKLNAWQWSGVFLMVVAMALIGKGN